MPFEMVDLLGPNPYEVKPPRIKGCLILLFEPLALSAISMYLSGVLADHAVVVAPPIYVEVVLFELVLDDKHVVFEGHLWLYVVETRTPELPRVLALWEWVPFVVLALEVSFHVLMLH